MDQDNQIKYPADIKFIEQFLSTKDVEFVVANIFRFEQDRTSYTIEDWTDGCIASPVSREFDYLINKYKPKVEELVGLKLKPTYTFWRLSHYGSRLPFHIDRPPCEVSVTINVGYSDNKIWPFFLDHTNPLKFEMKTGDAVLYNGMKYIHWRNPLESEWAAQFCLHYVDINGKYKNISNNDDWTQMKITPDIENDYIAAKKLYRVCEILENNYKNEGQLT